MLSAQTILTREMVRDYTSTKPAAATLDSDVVDEAMLASVRAMQGVVASPDGSRQVRRRIEGEAARAAELGRRLADDLAAAGAIAILNEVR